MPEKPTAPAAPATPAFSRAVVLGACGFLGREVVRQLADSGALVLGIDTRPWPGALPAGYVHNGQGASDLAGALAQAAAFLAAGQAGCSESCSAGQGDMPPGPPLGKNPEHPSSSTPPFPPNGIPKGECPLAGVQGAAPPDSPLPSPSTTGPAAFFHLAGLADAGACQRDPALAQALNVDLVAQALAALSGVACVFVFPSTGIVYGDALDHPAREDDPLLPTAEYARGKIAAEALIRAACAPAPKPGPDGRGRLCGAIARLSNLYGPGGGENTVLGRILAQARHGGPLQVWDESPVRDFLYVSDAAQGLLRLGLAALARRGQTGGSLTANLCTGQGTRISALLDLGAELFHTSRLPQERELDPAARASSLVLDPSLLEALTGWRPATSLAEGLTHCYHHAHSPAGQP